MRVIRGALPTIFALLGCSGKPPPAATTAEAKPAPAQAKRLEGREIPPELRAMLQKGPCEPRLRVALEHHILEPEESDGPRPKAFLIGPGEKLCLIGSPSAEGLIDPTVAAAAVNDEGAANQLISVEFAMLPMGAVLVVRNHHERPLSYRAVVKAPNHEPEATSVCSVLPNLAGVEHWPNEIEAVMFGDFKLLAPSKTPECR